jgi:hypothetical protein
MTRFAMNVEIVTTARHLKFHIWLDSPDVLDLMAFVSAVAAKYYGTIRHGKSWKVKSHELFCSIDMKFSNAPQWMEARKFCKNHLDEDGHVRPDYREALEAFDPGWARARELLARINPPPPVEEVAPSSTEQDGSAGAL